MDADDSLPWPDPVRSRVVGGDQGRFQPGVRHFMGEPVDGRKLRGACCAKASAPARRGCALPVAAGNPGRRSPDGAPAWRRSVAGQTGRQRLSAAFSRRCDQDSDDCLPS